MAVAAVAWRKLVAAACHGRVIAPDQHVGALGAARMRSIINSHTHTGGHTGTKAYG